MDALKKGILYICASALIFCAGYYLGGRADVSSDGDAVRAAENSIQSAQNSAGESAGYLDEAEGANRDAQSTAGDITDSNEKLSSGNAEIADLIKRGKQLLEKIRRGGETNP